MEETEEKKGAAEGRRAGSLFLSLRSFHCYLLLRGALVDDMTFKLQEHELTMSTGFLKYIDVPFISYWDALLSHALLQRQG